MATGYTSYERLTQTATVTRGQAAIDKSKDRDSLSGIIDCCREHGVEIVCSLRDAILAWVSQAILWPIFEKLEG